VMARPSSALTAPTFALLSKNFPRRGCRAVPRRKILPHGLRFKD
jgi:hypothetical protein